MMLIQTTKYLVVLRGTGHNFLHFSYMSFKFLEYFFSSPLLHQTLCKQIFFHVLVSIIRGYFFEVYFITFRLVLLLIFIWKAAILFYKVASVCSFHIILKWKGNDKKVKTSSYGLIWIPLSKYCALGVFIHSLTTWNFDSSNPLIVNVTFNES